jgi:hypothetical protein
LNSSRSAASKFGNIHIISPSLLCPIRVYELLIHFSN